MGLGKAELSFTVLSALEIPVGVRPRWVVLGRSNVGKSSFLNALIHPQTLFRTGKTPGVTIGLIAAKVWLSKSESSILEIVDVPGFGYAKPGEGRERSRWDELMNGIRERSHDRGLHWIWLADPMRKPADEEVKLAEWLGREPYSVIFTKSDQIKPNGRKKIENDWKSVIERSTETPVWSSSLKGEGFKEIMQSARSYVRFQEDRKVQELADAVQNRDKIDK